MNRQFMILVLIGTFAAAAFGATTDDSFPFAGRDWKVFDWTTYAPAHYVPRTPDDVIHSESEVAIRTPDQYIFRAIKTVSELQESPMAITVELWQTESFNWQSFPFNLHMPCASFSYFNWNRLWYISTVGPTGDTLASLTVSLGTPVLGVHYFARFVYDPASHTVAIFWRPDGAAYTEVYRGPAYWGRNDWSWAGESGRLAKIALGTSDGTGTAHYRLTCEGAGCAQAATLPSLMERVQDLASVLNGGQVNSLLKKLDAAQSALARGQLNAACGQLGAFANEVEALLRSGRLTAALATPLLTGTEQVRAAIPCKP